MRNDRAGAACALVVAALLAGTAYPALAQDAVSPAPLPSPVTSTAPSSTIFTTRPPAGFEDLLEEQDHQFQLYLDGSPVDLVTVITAPGTVRFADPAALIARLPPLRDPARVADALRGALPSNAGKSCRPRPVPDCGRIDPEVVGVIVSRDSGRIDLFLAPDVRGDPRRFLPDPMPGPPSVAGALGLQYSASRDYLSFSLQPRFVVGMGRRHFSFDATVSDRYSSISHAFYRRAGDRQALSLGLIDAESFSFAFFERLVGFQFASSTENRIERGDIADTPLVLDVPLSGRVEILRDGVLLDTQRVAPGRAELNTAGLPGGSYPLTLRILDASGERTEDVFFTRAPGLPGYGDAEWFVEGGWNTRQRTAEGGFLPALLSPTIRAGYQVRAAPQLGLFGRLEVSEKRQLVEAGLVYFLADMRMAATVAGTARAEYAAQANASGSLGSLNWSLDARHIRAEPRLQGLVRDSETFLTRSNTSLSATGGWRTGNLSLRTSLRWRRNEDGSSTFNVLPGLRWTFARSRSLRWQFDTSGRYGSDEWGIRAGVRLSASSRGTTRSLQAGGEARQRDGTRKYRPTGSADWSQSRETSLGPLQLRAGVDQQYDRLSARAGANLRMEYALVSLDAQIEEQVERSSLFGRVETSFGIADGRLAFGSDGFTGSGVVVAVPDADDDARYQLRTTTGGSTSITGSAPRFAATTPYSMGEIGIDSRGGATAFDTSRVPALFFPGTVVRLERTAKRVVLVYGQLVDAGGAALANVSLISGGGIGRTDAEGRFQIEVDAADGLVRARAAGGATRCEARASWVDAAAVYVNAGSLVCQAPHE